MGQIFQLHMKNCFNLRADAMTNTFQSRVMKLVPCKNQWSDKSSYYAIDCSPILQSIYWRVQFTCSKCTLRFTMKPNTGVWFWTLTATWDAMHLYALNAVISVVWLTSCELLWRTRQTYTILIWVVLHLMLRLLCDASILFMSCFHFTWWYIVL